MSWRALTRSLPPDMLTIRMKRSPKLTFAVLLMLTALALVAWVLTNPGTTGLPVKSQGNGQGKSEPQEFAVDDRPLVVARSLAAWAGTPEEQELVRNAERIA